MGKVVIFPNTRSISCLPTQTVVAEQAYLDLGHGIVHVVNNILHGVLELQLIEQIHAVVVDRDTGGLSPTGTNQNVMSTATNHSTATQEHIDHSRAPNNSSLRHKAHGLGSNNPENAGNSGGADQLEAPCTSPYPPALCAYAHECSTGPCWLP